MEQTSIASRTQNYFAPSSSAPLEYPKLALETYIFSVLLTPTSLYDNLIAINFPAPCDFSDEDMSVIDGELSSTSSGGGGKKGTSGLMSGGAGGNGGLGLSSKKANDRKSARARTVLSEKQLNILKTCYSANPRPDALMKEQLVEMTGLSPRVVRVWFQNKRCKDKKIQNRLMEKQMQRETVRYLFRLMFGDEKNCCFMF